MLWWVDLSRLPGAHPAALNSHSSTRQEENVRQEKLADQAKTREITYSDLHRQNRLRDNSFFLLLVKLDLDSEKQQQNQNHIPSSFSRRNFSPSLPPSQVSPPPRLTPRGDSSANRGCSHSTTPTLSRFLLLTLFQHASFCVLQSFRINLLQHRLSRGCSSLRKHHFVPAQDLWQAAGGISAPANLSTDYRETPLHDNLLYGGFCSKTGSIPSSLPNLSTHKTISTLPGHYFTFLKYILPEAPLALLIDSAVTGPLWKQLVSSSGQP